MGSSELGGMLEVSTGIREEDGKASVTVALEADEVKVHIDRYFKELAKSRIPGFRPGKAPRKVLEQNFGGHDYIYAQITTDLVNDVAALAVDGQDMIFISDPEFDEDMGTVSDGEPFTFTVYAEVKPTLTLSSYEPVEITLPDTHVTDEEIDAQIDNIREYSTDIVDVERAATEDDFVVIEVHATDAEGAIVPSLDSEERLVQISAPSVPKAVAAELVGMEAGQSAEFDAEIGASDGPEYAAYAGAPVHVALTVSAVRAEVKPEADDAFAKTVGFESMTAMRVEICSYIKGEKDKIIPEMKEDRCVRALAERVEGEVSEAYVATQRQEILRNFFNRLQQQNVNFDAYLQQQGITSDQFQADLDAQAQETATQCLALDALFTGAGLELTDEDIDEAFADVDDPDISRESWEQSGRMSELREALRRQKASKWVLDTAIVTTEEPAPAEDEAAEEEEEPAA